MRISSLKYGDSFVEVSFVEPQAECARALTPELDRSCIVRDPRKGVFAFLDTNVAARWRAPAGEGQGLNHALPICRYTAVVPGLWATSMPACKPKLRASS